MTLRTVGCLLLCAASVFAKERISWDQGRVCTKSGVCLDDVHFENGINEANYLSALFVNNTNTTLSNCSFRMPVYFKDVMEGSLNDSMSVSLPPGGTFAIRARDNIAVWEYGKRLEISCAQGSVLMMFRYPVFSMSSYQRDWRKKHERDPFRDQDPNQIEYAAPDRY
jgi:hypothetical protein